MPKLRNRLVRVRFRTAAGECSGGDPGSQRFERSRAQRRDCDAGIGNACPSPGPAAVAVASAVHGRRTPARWASRDSRGNGTLGAPPSCLRCRRRYSVEPHRRPLNLLVPTSSNAVRPSRTARYAAGKRVRPCSVGPHYRTVHYARFQDPRATPAVTSALPSILATSGGLERLKSSCTTSIGDTR